MEVEVQDIQNLLNLDPYLKPYEKEIRRRYNLELKYNLKIINCSI